MIAQTAVISSDRIYNLAAVVSISLVMGSRLGSISGASKSISSSETKWRRKTIGFYSYFYDRKGEKGVLETSDNMMCRVKTGREGGGRVRISYAQIGTP
jgi:hypothetical protein